MILKRKRPPEGPFDVSLLEGGPSQLRKPQADRLPIACQPAVACESAAGRAIFAAHVISITPARLELVPNRTGLTNGRRLFSPINAVINDIESGRRPGGAIVSFVVNRPV